LSNAIDNQTRVTQVRT